MPAIAIAPEKVLEALESLTVPYALRDGVFRIHDPADIVPADMLTAVEENRAELTAMILARIQARTARTCARCRGLIHGAHLRVYDGGDVKFYHSFVCGDGARAAATHSLPSGAGEEEAALIIDDGLCIYCQTNKATYPERSELPTVCAGCHGAVR